MAGEPHLIRVTLRGPELRGFVSASFDDHVKVFFPAPGSPSPVLPAVGPDASLRGANTALAEALSDLPSLPRGAGYAWAAGEMTSVRQVRSHLLSRGMDRSHIRAAAYWKRGAEALHQVIED